MHPCWDKPGIIPVMGSKFQVFSLSLNWAKIWTMRREQSVDTASERWRDVLSGKINIWEFFFKCTTFGTVRLPLIRWISMPHFRTFLHRSLRAKLDPTMNFFEKSFFKWTIFVLDIFTIYEIDLKSWFSYTVYIAVLGLNWI